MNNAWSGADPVEQADSTQYSLGARMRVEAAVITVTHLRIHTGAGEVGQAGRTGKIWSDAGAELASVVLSPSDLPTGWSLQALATPLELTVGQIFVPAFSTYGRYSALIGGVTGDVVSADGNVTVLANGGRFAASAPETFPTSASNSFYGVDIVYVEGSLGQNAPTVTDVAVQVDTAGVATSIINVTDPEGLVGASYRWDWGDGSPATTSASNTAQHAYTATGVYPILAKVTDSTNLSGYGAGAAVVELPEQATNGLSSRALIEACADHLSRTGWFDAVNERAPISPPGRGITAAVWMDAIRAIGAVSGLNCTAARVDLAIRFYHPLMTDNPDRIDPDMVAAADALCAALNGDFTLGGLVHSVDVLGAYGQPLAALSGYLSQSGDKYRVITVSVGLIVPNAWPQEG